MDEIEAALDAVETLSLVRHPASPPSAVREIEVQLWSVTAEKLHLRYIVTGDVDAVRWPDPGAADRTDGLWKHSCFEAFRRSAAATAYQEFNFSSSTAWAAYEFASYRKGGKDLALPANPQIWLDGGHDWVAVEVEAVVPSIPAPWVFNLSAVIEEKDGTKSYWALKHPDGQADFHDPACFILQVDAPRPA